MDSLDHSDPHSRGRIVVLVGASRDSGATLGSDDRLRHSGERHTTEHFADGTLRYVGRGAAAGHGRH